MEASDDRALLHRANDLYWHSDDSVNGIADELELSKGALYDLVEALPTTSVCPQCGETMEYPNRTARDRGYVSCPACGLEGEEDDMLDVATVGSGAEVAPGTGGTRDALNRMLLGSALLGAAAGVALTLWVRRKG